MRARLAKLFDPTFFRFILVGLVNTAVGYGVMFGLYNLTPLNTWGSRGQWIASAANYLVGSVVSFFLNKHFTFRSREKGGGGAPLRIEHHRVLAAGLWPGPAHHGPPAGWHGVEREAQGQPDPAGWVGPVRGPELWGTAVVRL